MKRYLVIMVEQNESLLHSTSVRGYSETTTCGKTESDALEKARKIADRRGLRLDVVCAAPSY